MSQSVRHIPVLGYAPSDKKSKVAAHRKLRRKVHTLENDPAVEVFPDEGEVTNVRRWRKSPRGWSPEVAKQLPKLMRK